MKVELDRLEGEFGVLLFEDSEVVVPRSWIPTEALEGHALVIEVRVDEESTSSERVNSALSRLKNDDVSGEGLEL